MKFLFLFFGLLTTAYSREIWNIPLTSIYNIYLEKDKPIQIGTPSKKIEILNLRGTLYSNSLSQLNQITDLRLFFHVEKIEPGAVCSPPSLKKFELVFTTDKEGTLTKETFNNCQKLDEFSLQGDYNIPRQISDEIFENLPNLENLYLANLKIKQVTRDYFKNSKKLKYLTLRSLDVEEIKVDAFNDLKNLEELEIFDNLKLTKLPVKLFEKNTNLKRLYLYSNNLSNLTWDEFEGLTALEELDVQSNQISFFDVEKIARYFPNLKKFNFAMNPVDCDKRKSLARELQIKLNHNITISYSFGLADCGGIE